MPPHRFTRRSLLAVIAAAATCFAQADESRGTFGLVANVEADGLFNPTLKAVHVQSVQKGLPAAAAGILAGDTILEVEGVKVAGAKASAMAERMKKKPGESVVLRLARANGETYLVTLVAVLHRN